MKQCGQTVSPMSNGGRNRYVVEHITSALLELMQCHHLDEISISQICAKAGVGRASFYRNFDSKEAVIRRHLKSLLDGWWMNAIQNPDFNLVKSIFEHYRDHCGLYIMLHKQGLSHLNLQNIQQACGPKPEQDNIIAYITAYFSYGLYGWIEEWFHRDMQETPDEMARLWAEAQNRSPGN